MFRWSGIAGVGSAHSECWSEDVEAAAACCVGAAAFAAALASPRSAALPDAALDPQTTVRLDTSSPPTQ